MGELHEHVPASGAKRDVRCSSYVIENDVLGEDEDEDEEDEDDDDDDG